MLAQPLPCGQAAWRSLVGLQGAGQTWGGCSNKISKNTILLQVEDLESRGGLLYRQAGSPESAVQMLVNDFHVRMKYYLNMTLRPGPRIVPSCHPGWGAVSDLGGSFAERGFKMGHRHSGTTTRAKTAPFQLSFHTLIFRCFVLIPSLCLLSASFFPLCFNTAPFNY